MILPLFLNLRLETFWMLPLLAFVALTYLSGASSSLEPCSSNVSDYFPVKVSPSASKGWNVSYHGDYKIAYNLFENVSYILYAGCGEGPADSFRIPLVAAGVTQTNPVAFLQQLDVLDTVGVYLSDPQYISSPCFLERIDAGDVTVLYDPLQLTEFSSANSSSFNSTVELVDSTVYFVNPYDNLPFPNTVVVSEYLESTNEAIYEWILFYSLFFNQEARALQLVQAAQKKYNCVRTNAQRVQADLPHRSLVLWAYYSTICGGWDVARCPGQYYCEFAQDCAFDLVTPTTSGNINSTVCGGIKLYNTDQIIDMGKDADAFIFPAPNWDQTYSQFKAQLDQMRSVQNGTVYDYQGLGPNAWFEERAVDYASALQDVCSVAGTTRGISSSWFRNVFQQPVGNTGKCLNNTDRTSVSLSPSTASCDDILYPIDQPNQSSGSITKPITIGLICAFLLTWLTF